MGPRKKAWLRYDFTKAHETNRLTTGDSTLSQESANGASLSRPLSPLDTCRGQPRDAEDSQKQIAEQDSISRELLPEARVVSTPSPERHPGFDSSSSPGSGQVTNSRPSQPGLRITSSPPNSIRAQQGYHKGQGRFDTDRLGPDGSISCQYHQPNLSKSRAVSSPLPSPPLRVNSHRIHANHHTEVNYPKSRWSGPRRSQEDSGAIKKNHYSWASSQGQGTTRAGSARLSSGDQFQEPDSFAVLPRQDLDGQAPVQGYAVEAHTGGNDMATLPHRVSTGDARRPSRMENRPPMSTVLCRNGPQCRKFVEGTCHYNHDFGSMPPNGLNNNTKKSLTVDSPAFTPKIGNVQPVKNLGISPKAAAAATFTPRGSGTATPATFTHTKEPSGDFVPAQTNQPAPQFQEFVPGQSFVGSPQLDAQTQIQQINPYSDPFLVSGLDGSQAQLNPYAQQGTAVGGQAFFQDTSSFKHPLNYHLYSSIGPRRENLATYQRTTADFFVPDDLREELQRKSEATLQTFANSTLPHTVEHFHSLVALDTNNHKGPTTFGYPSWIYKAISSKDGHTYALRRVEGYRLTTEASIRTCQAWKRINSASLVQVHDAFTGRWFSDSSLIIVTDYHPRSQTLAEKHFPAAVGRNAHRPSGQITSEDELWGYIVQLASALKTIHEAGLAARTVMASKVLLTSKNRLRLNGCGVFDIVHHDRSRPLHELQRSDLQDLGRLVLGIAARNQTAHQNLPKALELVSRSYSERLRSCLAWLLVPPPLQQDVSQPMETCLHSTEYNVNALLTSIADQVVAAMDSTLHLEDELTTNLGRELENGRLVRLLAKLNVILERPDTSSTPSATSNPALLNQPSATWSETGERYYLKLFRDFVFHQVDHDGRPVLDLGHIITCLNKLDAGIDEKVQLMSRDELSVFVTSYKEVKRGFEAAWAEISKASNPARR